MLLFDFSVDNTPAATLRLSELEFTFLFRCRGVPSGVKQ